MPYFVAIEIQNDELLVAVARSAAKRMQFEQTFSIPITSTSSSAEIGELLKKSLNSCHVSKCDVVAVVRRRDAEIREINVPPAPDNELPDLVKFRARAEFGSLNENWLLDFVPFSDDAEAPREVLAVAVAPEVVERFSAICEAASLRLKHVLFRPFAVVDLLRPKLLDGECRLIVDKLDDAIDLTISRGASILSVRTVKKLNNDDQQERVKHLAGEARRTVASVEKRLEGIKIQEIILCQQDDLLATELAERLQATVKTVDAFESAPRKPRLERPGYAEQLTAVFGALLQHDTDLGHEIDFLNPRRKVVKETNYRRFATIGIAAIVGFLCLSLIGWFVLRSQQNTIREMTESRKKLEDENLGKRNNVQVGVASAQIIGEVGKVDDWKANDLNWLEELYQVSDRFMTPDDAIVDSLEAGLRRDESQIKIIGRSAGAEAEKQLKEALMQRPYGLNAPKTTITGDETYPQGYEYILFPQVSPKSVIDEMDARAREFRAASNTEDTNENNPTTE